MSEPVNKSSTIVQQGFTLVEVMVALVIFSVGLLGMAGLQMEGMQSNHGALMRTIATQHSYNMAEQIRSSRADICTTGATCTGLSLSDYNDWSDAIQATLPGGTGAVASLGGSAVQITVRWDEDRTGATGTNCPPQSAADLQCVQLRIIP